MVIWERREIEFAEEKSRATDAAYGSTWVTFIVSHVCTLVLWDWM